MTATVFLPSLPLQDDLHKNFGATTVIAGEKKKEFTADQTAAVLPRLYNHWPFKTSSLLSM